MKQYGPSEIEALIIKLKEVNQKIGSVQTFTITSEFKYFVKLTNGTILIEFEELESVDHQTISSDTLALIAKRFKESKVEVPPKEQHQTPLPISEASNPKPKNPIKTILTLTVVVLVVLLAFWFINGRLESSDRTLYEVQKMSIEETEKLNPAEFLLAYGEYRENFWGNKFKIDCTIENRATVATYKDVQIRITFYTKTGTAIADDVVTIYEIFGPSSQKTINLQVDRYENVSSVDWEVIDAQNY